MDTCCINKQSDAELTEAINSMFQWYHASAVCYLYLFDVVGDPRLRTSTDEPSKLFERGWTLQELLAPHNVVVYDQNWRLLGTKDSLSAIISRITNVDETILRGKEKLTNRSIAQRMSWASGRQTTREEDRAYSLLGIFGVYMPTVYGEGRNAFLRLQQEIITQSDDHSIFAWPIQHELQPGLLAPNPDVFADCEHIVSQSSRRGRSPYSMTNRGLSIKLLAVPSNVDTYFVRLDCADQRLALADDDPTQSRLGMFLRRLHEDDQYARVTQSEKTFVHAQSSLWEKTGSQSIVNLDVCVKQNFSDRDSDMTDRINGFRIVKREVLTQSSSGKPLFKVGGPCTFDVATGIMTARPRSYGTTGWLNIDEQQRKLKVIKLGFDLDFNPVCFLASDGGLHSKSGGAFDRTGHFNFSLDSQIAQYTKEELAQWPGIHQRDPLDQLAWNELKGTSVMALSQRSDLWALKGDRLDGLHVKIPELCELRIVRGEWDNKLVWEVHVENLENSLAGDVKGFFKRPGVSRDRSEASSSYSNITKR